MKNLSLGLNIILLLAVGFLFVQHFSGNTTEGTGNGEGSSTVSTGKIAYLNIDTLYAYYDYYKDIKSQIEAKGQQASVDLQGRATKFAGKRDKFIKMAQAGLLSNNESQKREQELMQEGQEIERYQASVQQGLVALEQEKTQELYDNITDFLDAYNEEKGYEYIMGYQAGNIVIMHANKANDITMEVVKALNEEYQAKKVSEEGKKETK